MDTFIYQIMITVWILLATLNSFVELATNDDEHPIFSAVDTLCKMIIFFVILCFVWGWFGF